MHVFCVFVKNGMFFDKNQSEKALFVFIIWFNGVKVCECNFLVTEQQVRDVKC